MYFDNIAQLVGQSSVPLNTEFIVGGFYAPGDGRGGTFVWIPGSALSFPDGGITFNTTTPQNGYFKRIYSGPINVRWFGAIISPASGLTDVTAQVHAARDSQFAKNGCIYFPADFDTQGDPKPYVGAFEFYNTHGEINITGDGQGSVLQANGSGNPVLRLGWKPISDWKFSRVSNLQIDGTYNGSWRYADGVEFADQTTTELSGRWTFENVLFWQCKKAVHKPNGNIGNSYINCTWESNEFGFYAQSHSKMHAGCDRFIGGHMRGCALAVIFIKSAGSYGQLILEGTTIENNDGFAIFIRLTGGARMTFNAVDMRNVWMEDNANASTVTIDNVTYNTREIRFEGVRSVSIDDTQILDIELISSSVNLYNCRSDNSYVASHNWPYRVDVDAQSALVAQELRYEGTVSENIFVNSISYDGSADIAQPQDPPNFNPGLTPSSVWGPLRTVLAKKVYYTLPYNIRYASLLDGTIPIPFSSNVFSTQVYGGVLSTTCVKLFINANDTATLDLRFTLAADKYYMWSIHALKDSHDMEGYIGVPGDAQLGQVILKQAQWACSYGIKRFTFSPAPTGTVHLSITNNGSAQGIIYLADLQVVEFDNFFDAVSYAQSRAFTIEESDRRKTLPAIDVKGLFRWLPSEAMFEIEGNYNVAGIERLGVGEYYINFVLPLGDIGVPEISVETSESGRTNIIASFEDLSENGMTVKLVNAIDSAGEPVDATFSLMVA